MVWEILSRWTRGSSSAPPAPGCVGSVRCVYIQGCARSGNTLLRELCVAGFKHTHLVTLNRRRAESSFERTVELLRSERDRGRVLIASRNRDSSLAMSPALLRENPDVRVLWMLRHPFDILTSVHAGEPGKFYVTPGRLMASLELYEQFRNEKQVLTVRYEDVVSDPATAQKKIADTCELELLRSFAECHKHFSHVKQSLRALHSIRPLDAGSIGRWKNDPAHCDYLRQVLAEHPKLISLARSCGYDLEAEAALQR